MPAMPKPNERQTRDIELSVRSIDEASRQVTVSFSSEQPYSRWWGVEVLSHSPDAVDLTRLNSIGVVLFNHGRDEVIGKIVKAWLGNDMRCYADIVFDEDELSERIFQKVKSGTLKATSVGYQVDIWEEVAAGKMSTNGRVAGPAFVATRWMPVEVSIVSVPADEIGRASWRERV